MATEAGELYIGPYHRACRAAADALTARGGTVLILSALYGLVPLDRVIAPYELRMGQPGSVTGERLRVQARALGVDGARDVVVLAGAAYTRAARRCGWTLRPRWPDSVSAASSRPSSRSARVRR